MKRISCLFIALLIGLLSVSVAISESYVSRNGERTATLIKIENKGKKLIITFKFKNSSSSSTSFAWSFSTSVYQDGVECSTNYFDSDSQGAGTEIKNGAEIEVTDTFTLRNTESLVEIETGTWVFGLDSFTVYYNPKTGKWGKKAEVTATKKPTDTPAPKVTPSPKPSNKAAEAKNSGEWICPNCGMVNQMNFCPNCGQSKPTPSPTPIITPVPMDINAPVEPLTKYQYTLRCEDLEVEGQYTGDTVDGFPHGYGLFESKEWFYIGDWFMGLPYGKGNVYYYKQQTTKRFSDLYQMSSLNAGGLRKYGDVDKEDYSVKLYDNLIHAKDVGMLGFSSSFSKQTFNGEEIIGERVNKVSSASISSKADIRSGDVIIGANGYMIDTEHTLAAVLSEVTPGDSVNLMIYRMGKIIGIVYVCDW